jgi:hypothetical protein
VSREKMSLPHEAQTVISNWKIRYEELPRTRRRYNTSAGMHEECAKKIRSPQI